MTTAPGRWLIAARASDLDGAPCALLTTEVDGESLVVFRTRSGSLACLEDRCCHRAVPLSIGSVDGEHIVCAYHGWEFDGAGTCRRIPSNLPAEPIPSSARVRSYSVAERGGFCWVWIGDTTAEPFPKHLLASEDETGHRLLATSQSVACSHDVLMESAVDQLSHITHALLGPAPARRSTRAAVRVHSTEKELAWEVFPLGHLDDAPTDADLHGPPSLRGVRRLAESRPRDLA